MDNTLYVALSRQMILRREMDVVANNVANADTAGFKVESVISQTNPQSLPDGIKMGPKNVQFALDTGLARNFGQGAISRTGAPLDMAIDGDGFFQITTAQGARFTRDGRFTTDATGRLTNAHGDPVADDAGGEITLDPAKGEPSVSKDGIISQMGQRVGRIGVYRFGSLSGLAKDGGGLYRNDSNQTPQIAPDAQVAQGAVEGSNVQPVLEITRMMEISREYSKISQIIDQTAELDRQSIQRLGKIAA